MKYFILILSLLSVNSFAQNSIAIDTSSISSGQAISASSIKDNLDEIKNHFEEISYSGVPTILSGSTDKVSVTSVSLDGMRVGKTYHIGIDFRYNMTVDTGGSFLSTGFLSTDIPFLAGKTLSYVRGNVSCNVNGSDNRHQTGFINGLGTAFYVNLVGDDSTVTGRQCQGTLILKVN